MKSRESGSFAAALMLLVAAAGAGSAARVVIAEQDGTWEMAYGDVYYRVVGYVRNESAEPVKYVKIKLELLDPDGKSVVELTGYNQKAEILAGVEGYDTGSPETKLEKVEPIKPGDKDLFRIGIGKNEIPKKPKFTSYRVTIIETK